MTQQSHAMRGILADSFPANSCFVSSSKLKQKTDGRPCRKEEKNRLSVIIENGKQKQKKKQLVKQIKTSHSAHCVMEENLLMSGEFKTFFDLSFRISSSCSQEQQEKQDV